MDDKDLNFLENLLPWSEQLPAHCRKLFDHGNDLHKEGFFFCL